MDEVFSKEMEDAFTQEHITALLETLKPRNMRYEVSLAVITIMLLLLIRACRLFASGQQFKNLSSVEEFYKIPYDISVIDERQIQVRYMKIKIAR